MHIDKLSLSYRCHRAIGNSLDLKVMIEEVLKTFVEETSAISATCYLYDEQIIAQAGKCFNVQCTDYFSKDKKNLLFVKAFSNDFNIIVFHLQKATMVFIYSKELVLDFIISMYESFRRKLNISINSCLNVQHLQESNKELKDLSHNLQVRIDKAVLENKEKEKQLFEQIKMSQMGELIGNIAHQWRQPLSVISTATSGMKLKQELNILTNENFHDYADSILENVTFLSKTIDEFRDYIKASHKGKEIIIQERFRMALAMVEAEFKLKDIELIEEHLPANPIRFRLISGELLQVLISILNNAKEAVLQNNNEPKFVKYAIYKNEYNTTITIEDSGGGIAPNIINKIFNPYFTTKHKSQGTGIGLYTSYDIITNHLDGKLFVKNTKHGAKFFIELPVYMDYVI